MFSGPILPSIYNLPDQSVHLRWTNKKLNSVDNNVRPDGVISIADQLQWSHDWDSSEAKSYQTTDSNHALARDVIRIGIFNKALINNENIRATIGFRINGFRITFYVVELNFHAIYAMTEVGFLEIPQSIE